MLRMKARVGHFAFATTNYFNNHRNYLSNRRKVLVLIIFAAWLWFICCQFQTPTWTSSDDGFIQPSLDSLAEEDMLGISSGKQHPIEMLGAEANTRFSEMLRKQSKTLREAVAEYKHRYNRPPPPGFDIWWDRAIELNATIVDNFDTVMASLEPFWGLSAREMRIRIQLAVDTHNQISHIVVKNHSIHVSEDSDFGHTDTVVQWMQPILKYLPDLEIAFSDTDEPRVVIPHDELEQLKGGCSAQRSSTGGQEYLQRERFEFTEISKQSTWSISTLSCPADSPSRSHLLPRFEPNPSVMFLRNIAGSKDICKSPFQATNHGFFLAPETFKWSISLMPIFSRSKISSFQDILLPATDYTTTYADPLFTDPNEVPWAQKANQLYWTGSSRDSGAPHGKWRRAQRFRFVREMNDPNQGIALLNETESGHWRQYNDTMSSLSDRIAVQFTSQMDCEPEDCEAQRQEFAFGEYHASEEAYNHRFVFDLDGHGFTERFYRLLASHSTVFKQTMFREWHDDRLIPWLHYVPVSLGAQELPETIRFFASERGEGMARKIAEAGREWVGTALRVEDLELAWFRIMLEYARLLDEGRDKEGHCR